MSGLLLLTRRDVAALLDLSDTIRVVEAAFRNHAEGRIPIPPGVLGAHFEDGGFHIKTGALPEPRYFAAKINANFPANPKRFGLPTIQGLIALFDAERGTPLALMDSIEITILRTAAASAVAARYLARTDAATVTICGCGNQGKSHLRAMMQVRPIRRAFAVDAQPETARWFAEALTAELSIDVQMLESLAEAVGQSDICVTCTTSRRPILTAAMVRPGMFIAAVGADNPEKQELEPEVLSMSKVVVDLLEQAAVMGDLHHAIAAGAMAAASVHAELGQVVAGQRAGRTSEEETFVFDSTGTALQDVAAAALVYERAVETGKGQRWRAAD